MAKRPLLKIESEYPEDLAVGVHRLAGRLLGTPEGYGLLERVEVDIDEGRRHVVLDLGGLEFANSSGMGILASMYNFAKTAEGTVTIVGAGDRLREGLSVIMLWDLVKKAESVDGALAALGEG